MNAILAEVLADIPVRRYMFQTRLNILMPCLLTARTMHETVLLYAKKMATPLYLCNRPPGAAGAIILTSEYAINGWVHPPKGSPSCLEVGCEMEDGHCVRCLHAEQSAIIRAAKHGIGVRGATIYSLLKPCYQCSKAIIAAGIETIYYDSIAYDEDRTFVMLNNADVKCVRVEGDGNVLS